MNELMTNHGLKKPVYETNQAFFKVTFQGPKDKITELVKTTTETDLKELGLNERQVKAVIYVKENGRITNKEYRELTGLSDEGSRIDLRELVKKGLLQIKSRGRNTYYVFKTLGD